MSAEFDPGNSMAAVENAEAVLVAGEATGYFIPPPTPVLEEIVRQACADLDGIEVGWSRELDADAKVVWFARLKTGRGGAQVKLAPVEGETYDDAWERAFRELGVLG